jgi:hypothetical protein
MDKKILGPVLKFSGQSEKKRLPGSNGLRRSRGSLLGRFLCSHPTAYPANSQPTYRTCLPIGRDWKRGRFLGRGRFGKPLKQWIGKYLGRTV